MTSCQPVRCTQRRSIWANWHGYPPGFPAGLSVEASAATAQALAQLQNYLKAMSAHVGRRQRHTSSA